MKRNLFILCDKANLERFKQKVYRALEDSVTIVSNPEDATIIYSIGTVSPEMQKQMDEFESRGMKVVHVNENLVNEQVRDKLYGMVFEAERER